MVSRSVFLLSEVCEDIYCVGSFSRRRRRRIEAITEAAVSELLFSQPTALFGLGGTGCDLSLSTVSGDGNDDWRALTRIYGEEFHSDAILKQFSGKKRVVLSLYIVVVFLSLYNGIRLKS